MSQPDVILVRDYFVDLQSVICDRFESLDSTIEFSSERIDGPGGGFAQPRVAAGGTHLEKVAVQFTHSVGDALPEAATARNPELAGQPFEAAAISLIVHPRNAHVPITHMNLRYFQVGDQATDQSTWYFGGGYDLTPTYGYEEDVVHWHTTARDAVGPHYAAFKARCDEYFFLPHRNECRGVGGIFFDDWREGGFEESFSLVRQVGDSFLEAYVPIVERRRDLPCSDQEKAFQLYRRGRYAEFNLAIDRGTKYGLQSGRRVESVLASLPPLAAWIYDFKATEGTPEARLTDFFLKPREWV